REEALIEIVQYWKYISALGDHDPESRAVIDFGGERLGFLQQLGDERGAAFRRGVRLPDRRPRGPHLLDDGHDPLFRHYAESFVGEWEAVKEIAPLDVMNDMADFEDDARGLAQARTARARSVKEKILDLGRLGDLRRDAVMKRLAQV